MSRNGEQEGEKSQSQHLDFGFHCFPFGWCSRVRVGLGWSNLIGGGFVHGSLLSQSIQLRPQRIDCFDVGLTLNQPRNGCAPNQEEADQAKSRLCHVTEPF